MFKIKILAIKKISNLTAELNVDRQNSKYTYRSVVLNTDPYLPEGKLITEPAASGTLLSALILLASG
jgi:hypothetical protein